MTRVSVIVPAYNAAPFLRKTLESVINGAFRDFELIVIDDGSTDGTAEVAHGIGDQRIRVISHSNRGMSATRNVGLELSRGDYVAFLDADDLWHPQKLALQVQLLDNFSDFDFCITEFESWSGEYPIGTMEKTFDGRLDASLTGWIFPRMILTNFALPSSVMFRRRLLENLGYFLCEDQQTDDWEYFVRASRDCQFGKLAAPLVLYRQHAGSLSRRVPTVNNTELMREHLLQRYGTQCRQGGSVDLVELNRRRYLGWRYFADAHLSRGDGKIGLQIFWRLMLTGPSRLDTLKTAVKSLRRRLFKQLPAQT